MSSGQSQRDAEHEANVIALNAVADPAPLAELIAAAREFVQRVEAGEIRSQHTYARFTAALDDLRT